MPDKPRVRRRYPKMPDVKISDMEESPPPVITERPAARAHRGSSLLNDEPLSIRYEGTVTAAIGLWRPNRAGEMTKYFDTRVRYDDDAGTQFLQLTVPAEEFLPIDSKVNVEDRGGKIRVSPSERRRNERGRAWSKPDVKTPAIVLGIILAITLAITLIGWVVSKSKVNDYKNPIPTQSGQIVSGVPTNLPTGIPTGGPPSQP